MSGSPQSPSVAGATPRSGIPAAGELAWGTHLCLFYEDVAELLDVLVPYFREGLQRNERCIWVISGGLTPEGAREALRPALGDLDELIALGRLEIHDAGAWYLGSGGFDETRALREWLDREAEARLLGFEGLRVSADTSWVGREDRWRFAEHEAQLDRTIKSYRMIALCTYPLGGRGAAEIAAVVSSHQLALLRDDGDWRAVENHERSRAVRELSEAYAAMEQRVAERTAELRAASRYGRSLIEASLDPLVTISPEGKIIDVNLATEEATGVPRAQLVGSDFSGYFTDPEEAREGYRKVIAWGFVRDYPLTIRHVTGRTAEVLFNASLYRDEAGRIQGIFAAARDVTERNQAARDQRVTNALLALFVGAASRKEYLESVVDIVRSWTGCQCVGLRLVGEGGKLSYEAQAGFSQDFLEHEGLLSLESADCICTRMTLRAPLESDRPGMTLAGSFQCDDTEAFASRLGEGELSGYRAHCFQVRFASLAAIPIIYRERVFGLIHLADRRPGQLSPVNVDLLESLSPLIGEALHRFEAEAELARHREHLEELVQQRTDELRRTAADLERSNEDLGRFAYVASHDLKEPLRAVAGYAGLLQRRYRGRLDPEAEGYLAGTVDGARRMQRLIDDLLAYSRVGTRGRAPEANDAQAALDLALANLAGSIREAGAEVTADPLPVLRADLGQLAQLLQNLVGNALKFRSERPPLIHVGVRREGGSWLFSVLDNGIGIDPQYGERVFEIFQRLHTRSAYPGTGIGLAICKRIVERHGGRIWVESRPGEGSTFNFTMPEGES